MGTLGHVTDDDFKQVVGNEGITIIDFFADWCGPCKMLTPILEKIIDETTDVNVYKLDVSQNQATAMEYGVRNIPMLLIFQGGQVKDQIIGLRSKDEILKHIAAVRQK